MKYAHAPRYSGAALLTCVVATLVAACSVYESGLLAAGGARDGEAGSGGPPSGGHAGVAQGGSLGGGLGGTGEPARGGDAGNASPNMNQAGATAAPEAGATGAAGSPTVEPDLVLEPLDDMEDGDAFVLSTDDRNGHWDVSHDATASATQTPEAASFVMTELSDVARPDSLFSAYTKGSGFKGWGAIMTVSMITWPVYAETPTYDASAYAGISFYAKAGAASDLNMRVRFVGAQTDDRGGQCTAGGDINTACYDHFFEDVKLSHEWQRFELRFSDFRQAGVGMKFAAIDLDTMYALEFFFPGRATLAGNSFELWVDDLAFGLK